MFSLSMTSRLRIWTVSASERPGPQVPFNLSRCSTPLSQRSEVFELALAIQQQDPTADAGNEDTTSLLLFSGLLILDTELV
jgi:hypothetical protein